MLASVDSLLAWPENGASLMLPERKDRWPLSLGAIIFAGVFAVAALVATGSASHATASYRNSGQIASLRSSGGAFPSAYSVVDPNYVTWYNQPSPWPPPITGAYVGIGGALGGGNIYNTATNGVGAPGTGLLGTGVCAFLCYGAPGVASVNVVAFGNSVSALDGGTFTTLGAPDDCTASSAPLCPGGISDQVFGLEFFASPVATASVYLAIDSKGNFATFKGFYATGAVIAGAGLGTPAPLPAFVTGSLVSHTGPGAGDIFLGSSGSGNYVKCDFGETTGSVLTCNEPLVVSSGSASAGLNGSGIVWATGGVQPKGTSGAYAPETFPLGAVTAHPQIITGTCSVTSDPTTCPFQGTFNGFPDTNYNCTISAQGSTQAADSYVKLTINSISIHSATSTTFSFTCIE